MQEQTQIIIRILLFSYLYARFIILSAVFCTVQYNKVIENFSVKFKNGNVFFRRISLLDVEGAGLPPSLPLHRYRLLIIDCFLLYL
jgi:hypothetical protein